MTARKRKRTLGLGALALALGLPDEPPRPPLTPPPTPAPPFPVGRPIDLTRLRSWLASRNISPARYPGFVIVFVTGAPPALASRCALRAWLVGRHAPDALVEQLDAPVPATWVRTIKLTAKQSPSGATIGALRVVAPPAPRRTST